MPRLGHMIVDGLALVFVGGGLTAVVVGYERNLPNPAAQITESAVDWADPVTTGSIAPRIGAASVDAASLRPNSIIEDVTRSVMPSARVWTDPPSR